MAVNDYCSPVSIAYNRNKDTGAYKIQYTADYGTDVGYEVYLVNSEGPGYANRVAGPFGNVRDSFYGYSGTSWGKVIGTRSFYVKAHSLTTGGTDKNIGRVTWTGTSNAFTFTVAFDHNNGTGDTTTETETAEEPWIFPPDPVKSGYAFLGWFTEAEGGTKIEPGTEFSGADHRNITTMYAHWEAMSILHYVGDIDGVKTKKTVTNIKVVETVNGEKVVRNIIGCYAVETINGTKYVRQGV